ncbi:hypothetical protein BGZ50_006248 [Haplosporangium sp. Z 11]|nr:hypothetical protein BGZ50_006248 [Haplosporangium sp. Z 11]
MIAVKDVVEVSPRLAVKSFKTSGVEYIVTAFIAKQQLLLCILPGYLKQQPKPCKHLFLIDCMFTTLWLNDRNIPESRIDVLPNNNNNNNNNNNEPRPELREFSPPSAVRRLC